MKLSAPPPSAPEPSTGATVPPPPVGTDAQSPAEAPPAVEKPAEKTARWPGWFGPADIVLSVLAVALAFLSASFAARNSDIWVHLGAGRMLTTGEYKLGSDPFSYVASDRTWVNHNWLFDLGMYLVYRGDGFLLVLLKALAVAAAFALVLGIRKPGQSLWPWSSVVVLAVLTADSQFLLRPYLASLVFFALTLLLAFRLPSPPGSWRLPIAIGIAFCLWSNFDAWFVLGPATLAILTAGEFIRQRLRGGRPESTEELLRLPDVGTLGKSLVVGTIACMINPHHVGVWEIPFELLPGEAAASDPRFAFLLLSPVGIGSKSSLFWTEAIFWGNVNGIAYGILLAAGIYATFLCGTVGRLFGTAAEVEPLPLPLAMMWIALAALSLVKVFALPFFALVTVPLVASRVNMFSSRLVLHGWSERRTRFLLMSSTAGRLFTILGLIGLGLAAWPGWLQAPASAWWESGMTPSILARRVEWKVEPDDDLQRAAEWLQQQHEQGRLPDDCRGFLASVDLANYCAWFAPREKVFVNSRYAHHKKDMPEFTLVRRGLGLFTDPPEFEDRLEAVKVLNQWNVEYVGIGIPSTDAGSNRKVRAQIVMDRMWYDTALWSPWYLNGRATVCGCSTVPNKIGPTFHRLALDPVVLACGPGVKPIAPVATRPPIVVQGGWDEFVQARPLPPASAEEVAAWQRFKEQKKDQNFMALRIASLLQMNTVGIALPGFGPAKFVARDALDSKRFLDTYRRVPDERAPSNGSFEACALLSLRAARKAIAESPDHPDGYYMLGLALTDRDLPIPDAERRLAQLTAFRQCLMRMPPPAAYRPGEYIASPIRVIENVAQSYLGHPVLNAGQPVARGEFQGTRVDVGVIGDLAGGLAIYTSSSGGRPVVLRLHPHQQIPPGATRASPGLFLLPIDSMRNILDQAEQYGRIEYTDPGKRADFLKGLEELKKLIDTRYRQSLDRYQAKAERMPKLRERIEDAISLGLVDTALNDLRTADLGKEFGEDSTIMALRIIALQLALGRLEDAAEYLATLRDELNILADKPAGNSQRVLFARQMLPHLEYQKLLLEGNFAEAGRLYEQLFGAGVGQYPPSVLDLNSPDMKGFDPTKADGRAYQVFGTNWPFIGLFIPGNPLAGIEHVMLSSVQFDRYQSALGVPNRMREDSEFFFRRGFLSLLEGDIPGAKARFASAHRQPPPGWKIPSVNHVQALTYLHMIERAEKTNATAP